MLVKIDIATRPRRLVSMDRRVVIIAVMAISPAVALPALHSHKAPRMANKGRMPPKVISTMRNTADNVPNSIDRSR